MTGNKTLKPLVINTRNEQAAGSQYTWNKLQAPEIFISNIVTQEVNTEQSEELDKLISGIPTPFARVAMFRYAINYASQAGEDATGLLAFYQTLQNEWKGLLACIALDNQPLSVEKIKLTYSDGKTAADTANPYEPKGALGNMLFEEATLWCDQQEQGNSAKRANPCLYIIRYNGEIIGGTSPESLLFTAPVYHVQSEKGFYSPVTKKFIDPLRANLSAEDTEKLYVYVRHVSNAITGYTEQFSGRKPDVLRISQFLNNWLTEIRSYAAARGYTVDGNAIPPNLNKFKAPYARLFNFQTTLYGYAGRISADISTLQLPEEGDAIEVELAELLLNPDTGTVAEIIFDDPTDAEKTGVHLLCAPSERQDQQFRYFTLPLSEKGLAIFQDELERLLHPGTDIRSQLSAQYSMEKKALTVTLLVDVNGNKTSFEKSYRDPVRIEGQKIICWPDFVSRIWNRYYLYSELPHNAPELKAFPLCADKDHFRLLLEKESAGFHFRRIAVNGKSTDPKSEAEVLVEYDVNKLGSAELKYEIYQSPDPFKAIALQHKNKAAGYVVFRNITSAVGDFTLKDYRSMKTSLNPVRVGFDFGSNNTCVSFAGPGETPQLIEFKNRRRFLLGVDVVDNKRSAAAPHEVFFFQNEDTRSNCVKSMVMIHDERRVKGIEIDPKITLAKEIKGGFPVFEKNIPVEDSTENMYTLRFANQPSYIKFNMKWSSDDKENAYKQGFLKSLWLKTYAELLCAEKYPAALVWAYPSSMNKQILVRYGILWNEVGQLNPLCALPGADITYPPAAVAQFGEGNESPGGFGTAGSGFSNKKTTGNSPAAEGLGLKAQTEAASVCKYALGADFEAGARGLIIGFDIGGSTTDILCIALKKDSRSGIPDDFKNTLIKQSSIKFAAGRLADATRKSKKFHNVLKSFCRKKEIYIHGITVPPERLTANTSAYYFNLIIDQLDSESDRNEFYQNIAADCPELFVVNAYMTGLILFYAGQLARKIRITQAEHPGDYLNPFEDVMIGCFGKGGRMFDWLRAMNEAGAFTYYKSCFAAGYGIKAQEELQSFHIVPSDPEFVKAEVSFGLSRYNEIHTSTHQISELIGEDGFTYNGAEVDCMANVESRFMQHFGNQFSTPRSFKQFTAFAVLFYAFGKNYLGLSLPSLEQDINTMRLKAYIDNIPEYQLAKRAQEFDFEAPVIILEGMCFLDTVLMQKMFSQ